MSSAASASGYVECLGRHLRNPFPHDALESVPRGWTFSDDIFGATASRPAASNGESFRFYSATKAASVS